MIGLPSSGLHSNGFSLVRKILPPDREKLGAHIQALGTTLGEELLRPTRIYVKTVLDLINRYTIKGIANITGGGFIENIPRMLPKGLKARIFRGSWPVLPVFEMLKDAGNLTDKDMYNTFNMGIGMVLAADSGNADMILGYLDRNGESAFIIGEVAEGEGGLELC